MLGIFIFIVLFKFNSCADVNIFFDKINDEIIKFNAIGADIAWRNSNGETLIRETEDYQLKYILWQHNVCKRIATLHHSHLLNSTQQRQAYLMCRGPIYNYHEARDLIIIYNKLQNIYNEIKVCIPNKEVPVNTNMSLFVVEEVISNYLLEMKQANSLKSDLTNAAVKVTPNAQRVICLEGARNFESLMEFSRNDDVLKWVWLSWREKMKSIREPYVKLVTIENNAAKRSGYNDIGESWREDVEMDQLKILCRQLYEEIRPLYELLHGVVRYFLRIKNRKLVPEYGMIPAHLLGNLWSQNWESLADLILPQIINLDERIKKLNWTVQYMLERTEDFYVSLGLARMSEAFWRRSIFTRKNTSTICLGAAADMYKENDVRISYCSGTRFQDFRVLHHEMGHIQYFMAYKNQRGIYRQANPVLHESIGDAVMLGVMTPQHLQRLRLITDKELYNIGNYKKKSHKSKFKNKINNFDYKDYRNSYSVNINIKKNDNIIDDNDESKQYNDALIAEDNGCDNNDIRINDMLMLRQALNKLPQIPYSYLIDQYRWRLFEGEIDKQLLNAEFLSMSQKLMGIAPPEERSEEYVDIGAELHVADNTPHIRYYLSGILQYQIFENLCKAAVFGQRNVKKNLPDSILLSQCDIYGFKATGNILKNLMSRGHSQHWKMILNETIGETTISAQALKRFYRPLQQLLVRLVRKFKIPIGW